MSRKSSPGRSLHPFRVALTAAAMAAAVGVWAFVLLGFSVAVLLFNPADTVPYAVELAAPGSRVDVEHFEVVSTWPLALEVRGMRIQGEDGAELFAVDRARIVTDPDAGWESGLWIRDMELHGPRVAIHMAENDGKSGETEAVWNPESLRGLFFYKEIHCTDGALTLHMGNRTVEVRDLAFSLEPAEGEGHAADPTLRTASLDGAVRALENGKTIARARITGHGRVQADRFAVTAQLVDGRVDMAGASGDVDARADFTLTPESLDVARAVLDLTPTDELRERTGIEGVVHVFLSGRYVLGESRYELTTLEAELPGVLSIRGDAEGGPAGLPDTATMTAHAPALGKLMEQARMHVPALESMQGEGGPVNATLRIGENHGSLELLAENATIVFEQGGAVTGRSIALDAATRERSALEAYIFGRDASPDDLGLAGNLTAVVDASGAGWAVQGAEIEAPFGGTVAAPSVTNATVVLPAKSLAKDDRPIDSGPLVMRSDAAWTGAQLDVSRLSIEADGVGVIQGRGTWSPGPEGKTSAVLSGKGIAIGGVSTLLDALAAVGAAEWSPSGAMDIEFEVVREGRTLIYEAQISGSAAAFASADGNFLGEKGSWTLDAAGSVDDAVSFDGAFRLDSGQFLFSRFFLDAGENPVQVRASGRYAGDAVRGLDLETTVQGIGRAAYAGSLTMGGEGGTAFDGNLVLASDALGALYAKGVEEPYASDLPVLSDYTVDGSMNLDVAVQGRGANATAAGLLTLSGASFQSTATGIQAQNVDIRLPVAYGREPLSGATQGSVRIGSATSPLGSLKNLSLSLDYTDGALRMGQDVSLPVLGGALHVSEIAVENPYSPDFAVTCRAVLEGAQFEKLDLGGMKIEGRIAGDLGALRLTQERLDIPGALGGEIFGGVLAVHDMAVVEPLTKGRQILATIGMDNVHLAPLSQATGIGKITGRLDVVVEDLAIVYGQPAAFVLTARSEKVDGVEQSISLKAVNSITVLGTGSSIGDAGVGVFGSFFKEFSYGEIGVQLSLHNDVFKVRGLIEEGGVEYLIKKPPLFGINVINRTPGKRVSFSDMLERLSRITAKGAGPRTETEFGAGGSSGETQGD